MKVIVTETYVYDGESPEAVRTQIEDAHTVYEHPRFVATAASPDELPHPQQDSEFVSYWESLAV